FDAAATAAAATGDLDAPREVGSCVLAFALIHDSIVGPPTMYGGVKPGPAAGGGGAVGGGAPAPGVAAVAGVVGAGALGATEEASTAGAGAATVNSGGAATDAIGSSGTTGCA